MLAFYLSLLDTEEEKSKFTQLYVKYGKLMKYIARYKLKDEYLAEDALHNAFIKLTRYLHTIEEIDCHKTKRFVIIVIDSVVTDMLRKDKHYPTDSYEELEPTIAYEEDMLDNVAVQELVGMIAELPEKYRVVLELRAYHHLSEKQIADLLGIEYAATRKRLERARTLLTQKLKEKGRRASMNLYKHKKLYEAFDLYCQQLCDGLPTDAELADITFSAAFEEKMHKLLRQKYGYRNII